MMKQYKKELIVSTLLALLPIAAGLLLWNRLPGQLATHWGMSGADRWSGKAAAVFLRPLLLLAAHYLVLFLVFRDAKNRNQSKKVAIVYKVTRSILHPRQRHHLRGGAGVEIPACRPPFRRAGTDVRRHRQLSPQVPPQPNRGHSGLLDAGQRGKLDRHPPLRR